MTVYLLISRETEAVVSQRVFATREAANAALAKVQSWVATEEDLAGVFKVEEVEVEDGP